MQEADNVGHLADCTNINSGSCQVSNPLAANLLTSDYYGGTVGKYLLACSRCGGLTAISETYGGAKASDARLMESAGFFDRDRCDWRYKCNVCTGTCRCQQTHGK